jgi:hypothetical protein
MDTQRIGGGHNVIRLHIGVALVDGQPYNSL